MSLKENKQVVTGKTLQLCVHGALHWRFCAESARMFSLQACHHR